LDCGGPKLRIYVLMPTSWEVMATTPILILPPEWDATESIEVSATWTQLGDGYRQVVTGCPTKRVWDISSPQLSQAIAEGKLAELALYQGDKVFLWAPTSGGDRGAYVCEGWAYRPVAPNLVIITATLIEVSEASCEAYANLISSDTLSEMIGGAVQWMETYTRSQLPFGANAQGTTVNNFHVSIGRNGYYPPTSGTSEGQSIMARSLGAVALTASLPTATKSKALALAIKLCDAAIAYSFGSQPPVPAPGNLWIPHWIMNAKESVVSKGPIAENPLNSGNFDTIVTFTNGVGQISPAVGGLITSDVYQVLSTDATLLWTNVYAPIVSGTKYQLEYYTFDLMLKGTIFRQPPIDNSGSGALIPSPAGEVGGIVKLVQPYTGPLRVIWASYSGPTIAINQGLEAYPMWRALRPTESSHAYDASWWYWDAFDHLYTLTGNPHWQRCRDATYHTTLTGMNILNEPYCFKRESVAAVWSYPGTQLFLSNNSAGYSATRTVSGCIVATINNGPEGYPSAELQNFTTQFGFVPGSYLSVECGCSVDAVLEIAVSTSPNAFDSSQIWTYYHKGAGMGTIPPTYAGVPPSVQVSAAQLVRWPTADTPRSDGSSTMWHPTALTPSVYLGNSSGSSSTSTTEYEDIDGAARLVTQITLIKNSYGYANVYFPTLEASRRSSPPAICYRLELRNFGDTGPITLAGEWVGQYEVVDSAGTHYRFKLPQTGGQWQTFAPTWTDRMDDGQGPPGGGPIQSVTITHLNEYAWGRARLGIWWIGAPPLTLPNNTRCYKFLLTSRVDVAHQVVIGDAIAVNSPVGHIAYQPGAIPFVVNLYGGGIDGWREGGLYPAYQSPWHMWRWGHANWGEVQSQCLLDAQAAYTRQSPTKLRGPMAPVFVRAVWSSPPYGEDNTWGWLGADPGTEWAQYCYRPVESAAKSYYHNRRDRLSRRVVMSALNWLDKAIIAEPQGRVPTNIKQSADPTTLYHDPGAAGIVLRAAIYANLSGLSTGITYRIIRRLYLYLVGQYQHSGTMQGSWSKSQPDYLVPAGVPNHIPGNYKEYFVFWHGEALDGVNLLYKHLDDLKIPPCTFKL
jgi:phage-related protein